MSDTITPKVKRLVEIRFADEELRKCLVDKSYASRHLGRDAANRYLYVMHFVECIDVPSDLERFAFLDTVAPTENGGAWSVALHGRTRVVLRPVEGGSAIEIMEVVA